MLFTSDRLHHLSCVKLSIFTEQDIFITLKEQALLNHTLFQNIKQLINTDTAFVRLVLYMRNIAYARNEAEGEVKTISTAKKGSVQEAYDDLKKKLKNYSIKYGEDRLIIRKFDVMLRTVNLLNGQGGVSRSIADAEKTWKEVSINTKYNCLYTAVCMSKNKHQYKELMESHELLLNQSKKLKFKLKGRFEINPKHTMSTDIEIQMCSDYLKTPIIVFNNLYMKVREFQPKELPKDKRTSAREALEIRISNGHYTSLIRRKDLTDDDLEVKVSQSKPELKNVDSYLEYNGDDVYELDAETGLQVEDTLIVKKDSNRKTTPRNRRGLDKIYTIPIMEHTILSVPLTLTTTTIIRRMLVGCLTGHLLGSITFSFGVWIARSSS